MVAVLKQSQAVMKEERFNIFVGAMISTLNKTSEDKKAKYEDIARVLMGSKAYLLFEFQTIIIDVSFSSSDLFRLSNLSRPRFFPRKRTSLQSTCLTSKTRAPKALLS